MQTTNHTTSNYITNHPQASKSNIRSMTRKELAQLAGVSERTLRRWLHSNHNQLIAAGYQASQRKLPPRVVKYLMEFYGIEG